MVALTQALASLYNSNAAPGPALRAALPGGFYDARADQNGSNIYPYAVFMISSSNVTSYFGTNNGYSEHVVEIKVTGVDTDVVGAAIETLHNVLRNQILVLSGKQNVNVYPMTWPKPLPVPDGVNEAGQDLRAWISSYLYVVRS